MPLFGLFPWRVSRHESKVHGTCMRKVGSINLTIMEREVDPTPHVWEWNKGIYLSSLRWACHFTFFGGDHFLRLVQPRGGYQSWKVHVLRPQRCFTSLFPSKRFHMRHWWAPIGCYSGTHYHGGNLTPWPSWAHHVLYLQLTNHVIAWVYVIRVGPIGCALWSKLENIPTLSPLLYL